MVPKNAGPYGLPLEKVEDQDFKEWIVPVRYGEHIFGTTFLMELHSKKSNNFKNDIRHYYINVNDYWKVNEN